MYSERRDVAIDPHFRLSAPHRQAMHDAKEQVRRELGRSGEGQTRESPEDRRHHDLGLQAGEVHTEAGVRPEPEVMGGAQVGAAEVEHVRVGEHRGIPGSGGPHRHHGISL